MIDIVKQWIRPVALINFLILVNLSVFDVISDFSGPMWGLTMLVFGFYFGERGAGNVINQYRSQQ